MAFFDDLPQCISFTYPVYNYCLIGRYLSGYSAEYTTFVYSVRIGLKWSWNHLTEKTAIWEKNVYQQKNQVKAEMKGGDGDLEWNSCWLL